MEYNYSQRSGKVTAPGGVFTKVWFTYDGDRAALKSRDYHLSIRDIASIGYEIGETTAEYFEIKPNIVGEFTYTATLHT